MELSDTEEVNFVKGGARFNFQARPKEEKAATHECYRCGRKHGKN